MRNGFLSNRGSKGKNAKASRACSQTVRASVELMEARYLLSGGTLDTSFTNSTSPAPGLATVAASSGAIVNVTVIQSDGKILEAGRVFNADEDMTVARFNADGTVDTTFGTSGVMTMNFGGYDNVTGMAVQSDGKILIGGYTTWTSGGTSYSNFALARLTSTGSLDTTFGPNATGMTKADPPTGSTALNESNGRALLLQSDGKIVMAGNTITSNGDYDFGLVRFNSDGTIDTGFGTNGYITTNISNNDSVKSAALQSDGKIVVVGSDVPTGLNSEIAVVRYTSAGALDSTFGSSGIFRTSLGATTDAAATKVAIGPNGKIVIGGDRDGVAVVAQINTSTSTLDTTFNSTGYVTVGSLGNNVSGVGVQADNKVLVTGTGNFNLGSNTLSIERLTTSGAADTGFNSTGTASVNFTDGTNQYAQGGLAIESDGKVVISAYTTNYNIYLLSRFSLTTAPTANAGGPYSLNEASTTTLSGAASSDPDSEALTYQWDLSYNGSNFNPTASGVSPTYDATHIPGTSTHSVALRVTDLLGASSSLSTATVTVNHVNPTVSMPATLTYNEGTSITLSATVGDDGLHDPLTYRWHVTSTNSQTLTDGTAATYSMTLQASGTYTATLTVTDASGATGSATTTITSTRVNPNVNISGPTSAGRDVTTSWTLSASGPSLTGLLEPITSWSVNWGDKKYDGSAYIESVSPGTLTHTFDTAGTYTVTATATDAFGSYTSSQSVTVGTGDPGDLAAGKGIWASSGTASNANDSNASTVWTSSAADSSQWIFVDLGAMYDINQVKITWGTNYAATFKLRVSNDSANWRDVGTGPTTSSGTVDTLSGSTTSGLPVQARYLQVTPLTPKSGATSYQIASLEIYGGSNLVYNLQAPGQTALIDRITQSTGGTNLLNTVDADGTTMWTSATVTSSAPTQYIVLDLGEAVAISEVKVWFGSHYAPTYHIAASNDGQNWHNLTNSSGSGDLPTGHAGLNDNIIQGNGRYVRINLQALSSGNTNYQIADLAVFGSNNLAINRLGGTTNSTTASSNSSTAPNATDGSTSTAWSSTTDSTRTAQPSMTVDLGDVFHVTHVNVMWGSDYATTYNFTYSNDGSTWLTPPNNATVTGSGGAIDTHLNIDCRYIRVTCTGYGPTNKFTITETQVFGLSDLAYNDAAVAQSNGAVAPNTTDENFSTSWSSATTSGEWLMIDLGSAVTVTSVTIDFGAAYASTFAIYSSNSSAGGWIDLASGSATSGYSTAMFNGHQGETTVSNLVQNVAGSPAVTNRFLLIYFGNPAPSQTAFNVIDVDVYGHE